MNRIENLESEERQAMLTAYALGELELAEQAEVEGWLAGSPAARKQLAELEQLNQALLEARNSQPRSAPSACLRLDVLGQLANLQGEPACEPVAPPPERDLAVWPRLAPLAASLLLTSGFAWALFSGGQIDPAQERLARQLERYDVLIQEARYSEALAMAQAIDRQVASSDLQQETIGLILGDTLTSDSDLWLRAMVGDSDTVLVPAMLDLRASRTPEGLAAVESSAIPFAAYRSDESGFRWPGCQSWMPSRVRPQ